MAKIPTTALTGWRRWLLMFHYILRDPYDVEENKAVAERLANPK